MAERGHRFQWLIDALFGLMLIALIVWGRRATDAEDRSHARPE